MAQLFVLIVSLACQSYGMDSSESETTFDTVDVIDSAAPGPELSCLLWLHLPSGLYSEH